MLLHIAVYSHVRYTAALYTQEIVNCYIGIYICCCPLWLLLALRQYGFIDMSTAINLQVNDCCDSGIKDVHTFVQSMHSDVVIEMQYSRCATCALRNSAASC
jgi:hypothetical protein